MAVVTGMPPRIKKQKKDGRVAIHVVGGNPAVSVEPRPVAFRPRLTTGVALSLVTAALPGRTRRVFLNVFLVCVAGAVVVIPCNVE